jgi:hypothetical protein
VFLERLHLLIVLKLRQQQRASNADSLGLACFDQGRDEVGSQFAYVEMGYAKSVRTSELHLSSIREDRITYLA